MQENTINTTGDKLLEKYPLITVIISNFVSLAIYGIGAYIMFWVGALSLTVYLVFIAVMEFLLYRRSCKDCYYYGKRCAFGKGKIACWFTKRGNPEDFGKRQVSWRSMIPDIILTVIPLVTCVVLIIIDFSIILPILLVIFLFLASIGNGIVRGNLACKYCKQRTIGCPAAKLFEGENADQPA